MNTKKLVLICLALITSAIAHAAVTINQYIGAWSATPTYVAGNIVTYNNQTYLALTAVAKNTIPNVNPSKWQLLGSNVTGPQGPQGLQGPAGATGPAGQQGIQGIAGAAGRNGTNGTNGTNGAPGAQGPAGPQGVAGPIGPQGPAGGAGPANRVVDANNQFIGYLIPGMYGNSMVAINVTGTDFYISDVSSSGFKDVNNLTMEHFQSSDCTGEAYYSNATQNLLSFNNAIFVNTSAGSAAPNSYWVGSTPPIAHPSLIKGIYYQDPNASLTVTINSYRFPGSNCVNTGAYTTQMSPISSYTLIKDLSVFTTPFRLIN